MKKFKGRASDKVLVSGKWYPWSRSDQHVCCNCNHRHDVDIKVDKRGVVWMRWTEADE